MSGRAAVEALEGFKWAFLALDHETQHRIARRIQRLARRPRPREGQLIAGTEHVYRLWERGIRLLYHYREDRITLLVVERHRSDRQVDDLIARRQRKAVRRA